MKIEEAFVYKKGKHFVQTLAFLRWNLLLFMIEIIYLHKVTSKWVVSVGGISRLSWNLRFLPYKTVALTHQRTPLLKVKSKADTRPEMQ